MRRWILCMVALVSATACSTDQVTQSTSEAPGPEAFAGVWRSVTRSLEFVRLTVDSKSSERGVFASRLTYSGLAWDGEGRVDGDSLVLDLSVPGVSGNSTRLVLWLSGDDTLTARHYTGPEGLSLTLVREH
jgi:hypothetical protein